MAGSSNPTRRLPFPDSVFAKQGVQRTSAPVGHRDGQALLAGMDLDGWTVIGAPGRRSFLANSSFDRGHQKRGNRAYDVGKPC